MNNGVTAHRGNAGEFPENTMPAFESALKLGADWIELDVHQTTDGVIVVTHDADLKRIAGVDALQWISGEQAERLIETMKKWAMRFLPQAVQALVPQVGALQLSDLVRGQLNAVLNRAFTRQTFDPMHSAWESLNDVLKRGR